VRAPIGYGAGDPGVDIFAQGVAGMLRYVNGGERRYGSAPVPVVTRLNWEFEAVLAGRMAPTLPDGEVLPLAERTLWVFPPSTAHGWTGDGDRPCEVAVVQPAEAPEPVAALARQRRWLAARLEPRDVALIRDMTSSLIREQGAPTTIGGLLEARAVAELCLIALRSEPIRRLPGGARQARAVTDAAVAWYVEHLERDPPLDEIAAAVGASASHLRRLFHAAYGKSPHAMLQAARFARAHELMRGESLALDAVAAACGFSDGSAFSRAFRQRHGQPPARWRKRLN
jgi:AraC-like DNA-binding protein